jgi:hypothetical protein
MKRTTLATTTVGGANSLGRIASAAAAEANQLKSGSQVQGGCRGPVMVQGTAGNS